MCRRSLVHAGRLLAPVLGFAGLTSAFPIGVARAQAQWTLVEEVRFGNGESDQTTFSDIRGLAIGDAGRILVLDYKVQEIRIFDASGKFMKLAARRGNGPGEIASANGLAHGPDGSIWVNDPANSRFSVFKSDGSFLRQHVVPIRGYGFIWEGMIDTEGRVNDPVFAQAPNGESLVRVRRFKSDGTLADTLDGACGRLGSSVAPWRAQSKGGSMAMTVPFSATARIRYDRRGFAWCTPSDVYRIVRVRLGSFDTVAVAERKVAGIPVSAEERAEAVARADSMLKRFESNNADFSQIPKVKPFVDALDVDDAGRLWVRRPSPDRSKSIIDVFDDRGRFLATVNAPFRLDPYRRPVVRGDVLYAVVLDDDDVQQVVRARIRR
jgi:hypothetical protein